LEAYGFLLGFASPPTIVVGLPVGKTSEWYDPSDRFARIAAASESARSLAASLRFEVMGLYHSRNNDPTEKTPSPITAVPQEFADGYICIKTIWGGEIGLLAMEFHYRATVWYSHELPKQRMPELPRFNPRRIHSSWRRLWPHVDYDNGFHVP
jgi:hypothetical protein